MFNYLVAFIFGFTQGVTEFLPISSSGHLAILHRLFKLPFTNELAFDVLLHLATLLALIIFFRKELGQIIKTLAKSLMGKGSDLAKLAWFLILGSLPAGLTGWLVGDFFENSLRSPLMIALMLIIVGILFLIFERTSRFADTLDNLNWWKVLLIGLAQIVALLPGVSRSGITIIAGLGTGLKRAEAVKFSFLLSIPIIAGAAAIKVPYLLRTNFSYYDFSLLALAFIAALIAGWLAIKYFLRWADRFRLDVFAYYRFILALIIVVFYFWK